MSLMSKYTEGTYKLKVESTAAVVDTEECITNQRMAGTALVTITSHLWHKRPVAYDGVGYCPMHLN